MPYPSGLRLTLLSHASLLSHAKEWQEIEQVTALANIINSYLFSPLVISNDTPETFATIKQHTKSLVYVSVCRIMQYQPNTLSRAGR